MVKNKIVLIIIIFSILLVIFGISINYADKSNNIELINIIEEKLKIIVSGNSLEANFEFIDNFNNKRISKNYLNMSNQELTENGYVEYIQSSEYMVEFYSKIKIKEISIKRETDNEIVCVINVNRPNLLEIMDECDKENIDNENYNFNETFINKLRTNNFKCYEETYEIILKKLDKQIKFKYDDNFKAMLYG